MDDDCSSAQFGSVRPGHSSRTQPPTDLHPRQEPHRFAVADVAGRHEQQHPWPAHQEMRVEEVVVLGDDDPLFEISETNDLLVRCPVPVAQVPGVHDVVTNEDSNPASRSGNCASTSERIQAALIGIVERVRVAIAANSNAARTSSRSRSG